MHSQLVHIRCDRRVVWPVRKRLKKIARPVSTAERWLQGQGKHGVILPSSRDLWHVLIDTAIFVFHVSRCLPSMVSLVIQEVIPVLHWKDKLLLFAWFTWRRKRNYWLHKWQYRSQLKKSLVALTLTHPYLSKHWDLYKPMPQLELLQWDFKMWLNVLSGNVSLYKQGGEENVSWEQLPNLASEVQAMLIPSK